MTEYDGPRPEGIKVTVHSIPQGIVSCLYHLHYLKSGMPVPPVATIDTALAVATSPELIPSELKEALIRAGINAEEFAGHVREKVGDVLMAAPATLLNFHVLLILENVPLWMIDRMGTNQQADRDDSMFFGELRFELSPSLQEYDALQGQVTAELLYVDAMRMVETCLLSMRAAGVPYELYKGLIPQGVTTTIVWDTDLHELRHRTMPEPLRQALKTELVKWEPLLGLLFP